MIENLDLDFVDEGFTNHTENISSSSNSTSLTFTCRIFSLVTYVIIIGTICLFGFLGNLISFYVFSLDKIKTSTLFLFQSLAVVDNMLLAVVFPLYSVLNLIQFFDFKEPNLFSIICHLYIFPLAMVAQTAIIWLTVLVAFNRYVAICRPFQAARLCTVRQAKIQLACVMTFSVLYNLPKFLEYYPTWHVGADNVTYIDAEDMWTEDTSRLIFIKIYDFYFYMIFMLISPLLILVLLNFKLICALKKLRAKRAEMQSQRQKNDNNVTLVLIIVVIVFIVCQTPALVNKFLWSALDESHRQCGGGQYYFSPLCNVMVVANSSVNIIIYLTFNARFRNALMHGGCDGNKSASGYRKVVGGSKRAEETWRAGERENIDLVI